jgi:tetratricopeptide (TPR) repeat protein
VKKWTITILLAVALLALVLATHFWGARVIKFAVDNDKTVDSLKKLLELLLLVGGLAPPVIKWLFGKNEKDSTPAPTVTNSHAGHDLNIAGGNIQTGGVSTTSQGPISIGGHVAGRDINVYESTTPPVLPSPYQLPPPPADFTGRTAELAELRAAIEKGGIHISGLQGQGGVGKTALALKLAAELAPKFPDAQIYLDLKGVSEKPLTAAEAMSHVLRTFHPEAKLPEKEEDLRALYLSVLHDKRALLLMDNAKDAAQLKSLIPPDGCMFLVTSRNHFKLPGLYQKDLNTFPPGDATKFLLEIEPRIKPEAEAIAKLCGYLALALRLAATAIAERPDLDPTDYRQKLADEKQRLKLLGGKEEEGMEASIALSYRLLTEEKKKQWRLLSVFPDTFDAPAAASVWEMEEDAAKPALGDLKQLSMLEWNDSTKRYLLHDLMRDFARQRLTTAESDEAVLLHARHYLDLLRSANGLYGKGGASVAGGLALFDLEWGNIQFGQAWAAAHAGKDRQIAQLCSDYPDYGTLVLFVRQHPREQIGWRKAAVEAARELKDRAAEGRHLGNLGLAYNSLGEYRRAIEYHEKSLAIKRETGDRVGEGQALINLGSAHYYLGSYASAIEHYENVQAIARAIGDRLEEARAFGGLGVTYYSQGEYSRAIKSHEQNLDIARQIGDQGGEGVALGNLGSAYYSLGDYTRATEYYEQQLNIAREIGDRRGEGSALWGMSLALDKLGDRKKAIERAEAALKILEQIEDPDTAKVRKQLDIWRNG